MVEIAPDFFAIKRIFADDGGLDHVFHDSRVGAEPVAANPFVGADFQQGLGGFPFGSGVAVPVGVAHGVGHGFEARGFHVGNFHNEPLSKKLLD